MKTTKIIALAGMLAASTVASNVMAAEDAPLTANIGVGSNYIWRGVTQNSDEAAISGGVDYAHGSGFYIGTWLSSLGGNSNATNGSGNGGYENDIYGGFGFDAGPVGLDVGYIMYRYPIGSQVQNDFEELYVNASWNWLSGGIAYTTGKEDSSANKNDIYAHISAEHTFGKGFTLAGTIGDYDYDEPTTEDYTHYQVSISKDDFTFALDKNNKSDTGNVGEDDLRMTVSYSKSFDLM